MFPIFTIIITHAKSYYQKRSYTPQGKTCILYLHPQIIIPKLHFLIFFLQTDNQFAGVNLFHRISNGIRLLMINYGFFKIINIFFQKIQISISINPCIWMGSIHTQLQIFPCILYSSHLHIQIAQRQTFHILLLLISFFLICRQKIRFGSIQIPH